MRRFLRNTRKIAPLLGVPLNGLIGSLANRAQRGLNLCACLNCRPPPVLAALLWFALRLISFQPAFGAPGNFNNIIPNRKHESSNAAAGFHRGNVYSMAQTGDGYLWIGTSKGLVRYDGLTFVPIRESDSLQARNHLLSV